MDVPASMGSAAALPGQPSRNALKILLLFLVIYSLTWAGHYTTGDGAQKVAWAKSMFLRQSADIGPGFEARYSKYGIGHSLISIPPLALAYWIRKVTGIHSESLLYTYLFIVNGAVFLALVAFYLSHLYPWRSVFWTVLIMGLATIWWPYTKSDFSEPLVLTALFAGFVLMRFFSLPAGMLVAGFAMTVRTDSVILIALLFLWALYQHRSWRTIVTLAAALLPWIALMAIANYTRWHSLTDHGYANERFSNPLLIGLYGIALSAGKSIFLFSPPLVLGVLGWNRFRTRPGLRADAWLFLGVLVSEALVYAKWWDWSGDWNWGDRFLIPGVLLMCIPAIEMLRRPVLTGLIAAAGLWVQLLAVLVSGGDYVMMFEHHKFERRALYVGGVNRVDFEDLRFNPSYSAIVGHWILVRVLLGIPPHPNPLQDTIGTRLYDTLTPEEWKQAAHWDFIWNLSRHHQENQTPTPAAP